MALARRAAYEADAAELGARLDMHAALLQVDIDTHTLWVTEPHHGDLSEGSPLER